LGLLSTIFNMHFIMPSHEVPHVNETVVGDPLLTVPIPNICEVGIGIDSALLCFEIHGERDGYFNLVTDKCTCICECTLLCSDRLLEWD